MVRGNIKAFWPVTLALQAFTPTMLVAAKGGVANLQKTSVGMFKIPFHDDRLNDQIEEANKNQTSLIPNLEDLFLATYGYWGSYADAPPEDEQMSRLIRFEQNTMKDGNNKYIQGYLNASRENATELAKKKQPPPAHPDVVISYLVNISQLYLDTEYSVLGAYMGFGSSPWCSDQINQLLEEKDEWEKLGSSAATTLMALLPTFLAFGNLYVPRSSEAYTTSALVGLATAFFTFGLPVQSMSAVKQSNSHTLTVFGIATLALIGALGKVNKKGAPERKDKLDDLQDWSREDNGDEVKARFVSIKNLVEKWESRWHLWHAPGLFVAAAQIVIFALAVFPLFRYLGVPKFIYRCIDDRDWTGLYLGVSAAANAVVRYVMWESSDHERVKVYALSDAAKAKLNSIVSNTDGETTETHLPPLLPPYVLAIRSFFSGIFRKKSSLSQAQSTTSSLSQSKRPSIFKKAFRHVRHRASFIFNSGNFFDIVKAGFIGRTRSARRWRPVYILVHLSSEARNPLWILLTGFIESALLLVLTFFFAAQWGGSLMLTMVALSLLLVFITLGRALGLLYVWVSSQVWGLTVVNCDTVDEIRGVLRIICSMEGMLVVVNGATYYGGYRMNERDGFDEFVEQYERGQFDEAPADVAMVASPTKASPSKDAKTPSSSTVQVV